MGFFPTHPQRPRGWPGSLVHLTRPAEPQHVHYKPDLSASHHFPEQPHRFQAASGAPPRTESSWVLVPSSVWNLPEAAVFQQQGGIYPLPALVLALAHKPTHPEDGPNPHILIQFSLHMLHPPLSLLRGKVFCLNAKFWLVIFFFKEGLFPVPEITHLCVMPMISFSESSSPIHSGIKEQNLAQSPEIFPYKSCISGALHQNCAGRFEDHDTT